MLNDTPLSKNTILWIKTGVVEVGVLFSYLLAFIVVILCTVPRYGFGSFKLRTAFYTGRLYFTQPFKYPTLGSYFIQFETFAILIVFLFIRLTILLSITSKNEYIAELLAGIFAISGKVLYFSLGVSFVYPILQSLPVTYFTIGESLSGNLSYLMDSPGRGFNSGIGPLMLPIITIEIFMLITSRSKRIKLIRR